VTRSARAGLLLFLPVLATSFFMLRGPLENRYTFANIFSDYPLRFAGPWLLAWMTARQLDGARPRARWPLFLVAGLVVLNNVDHGLPALCAVIAALLWSGGRPSWASLRRLALELVGGLAGAFALVATLTLARAGALPDPDVLLAYARLFARAGYAMLPMPTLGFHTVIYVTFVAAIGVATVRAIAGEQDRLLTGMLAWGGVFGLVAGGYYVGRSHPEVLIASFSVWALTSALLLVVVLRNLAARPSRWPAPAELACLVAFGLAACSLAQTPTPWAQLQRLRDAGPKVLARPIGQAFVASATHPGEPVALLATLGHRLAYNVGIDDVTPYTGPSVLTDEQLEDTVRALRDAGGRKLFLSRLVLPEEVETALQRRAFRLVRRDRQGTELWIRR
jgi:hypothetical protein